MIKIENLRKSFGRLDVLKGITEHIAPGEVVSVIGPSGSGKSTFLRCINLLEEPSGGAIYFQGIRINDPAVDINELRRKVGMVFQLFNLFPHKSVLENITVAPLRLKIMGPKGHGTRPSPFSNPLVCGTKSMPTPPSCPAGRSREWPSPELLSNRRPLLFWTIASQPSIRRPRRRYSTP